MGNDRNPHYKVDNGWQVTLGSIPSNTLIMIITKDKRYNFEQS